MKRARVIAAAACLVVAAAGAAAQNVVLSGMLGQSKALLLIDGQPYTLAPGASARGVTLKRLADGEAQVEVAGRLTTLRLGGAPARLGGAAATPDGDEIVLPVGPGGHFMSAGSINGKTVRFMVDTGATTIALSQAEAARIGLEWRNAPRALSQTAGGTVAVHTLSLSSVRLGDVEIHNVQAVVVPSDMPFVLLGNSFLARFSMQREGDTMRLRKRQ